MELVGKNVLVVGTGISGVAAVKLLSTKSANIIFQDANLKITEQDILDKLPKSVKVKAIVCRHRRWNFCCSIVILHRADWSYSHRHPPRQQTDAACGGEGRVFQTGNHLCRGRNPQNCI